MKRIHIKKPDIKGFFTKVKNLKPEDIKRHYQEKKARRQRILEQRRNSKFAKKMQPVYKWMNRFSLVLHYLLACVLNFLIEVISRHSFFEAWSYMTGTPLVFLFNAFLIFATFMIVYLFRRRVFVRILLSVFWLFLGACNGYLLLKRVTPFNAQDLKVLSDALELTSNYFNGFEIVMLTIGIVAVVLWVISMWRRGGQYTGKMHRIIAVIAVVASGFAYVGLTDVAIDKRVISNYFGNIAFAYEDYGFPYCFAASLFNTGINQPAGYSEETMAEINKDGCLNVSETSRSKEELPNIMFVQLESYFDPTEVEWLRFSEDPIPNLRKLYADYSSGYFKVPSVGAGTANTEFEVLTGMNMRFFGPGEYPYKTILKETTCESAAYDLKKLGYSTHAIHNNEANFYGRRTVFSRLGFDTFTSEEYMPDISDTTPMGWVKDHILTDEIFKAMESTEGPDYVYTISVQGHGDYPTEPVLSDPEIKVTGAESEEKNNAWEYYVNQLHEMDQFVKELTDRLSELDERVVLVMYGDHLPTMDLKVEDMKNRYLFQTKYVMWSNFDMKKKDKNIAAYQMAAEVFNRLGIHEGTVFNYHQTRKGSRNYQLDLQALQYDILYGKQYVYGGENPFEATKMQLGIYPATLERLESIGNGSYYVYGTNFTAASRLEINKELQETQYISPTQLLVQNVELADGDQVSVATQSNSSTKKVLSRTDYLTYNEDNGELMSQENYQAKKSAKAMLERLKEQHAEQTEDDGQAAEETPTEETTPELSLTPAPASTPES